MNGIKSMQEAVERIRDAQNVQIFQNELLLLKEYMKNIGMEKEDLLKLERTAYYIKNEYQKLDIYKRIAAIESEEELEDMTEELIDRFGDIPKAVANLLQVALLKAMAHKAYVTEVRINRQEIRLTMYQNAKLDTAGIPELVASYGDELRFVMAEQPYFLYVDRRNKQKDCAAMMELARTLLGQIIQLSY